MNRRSAQKRVRLLIGICTFIFVVLGLSACWFIEARLADDAAVMLVEMVVYFILLRFLWNYSCTSSR